MLNGPSVQAVLFELDEPQLMLMKPATTRAARENQITSLPNMEISLGAKHRSWRPQPRGSPNRLRGPERFSEQEQYMERNLLRQVSFAVPIVKNC
jgi:hypothetical protein